MNKGKAMSGSTATPTPLPKVSEENAITARASVSAMVPVSVIQKRAGGMLNHKKAKVAPAIEAESPERAIWFCAKAMYV